MKKQQVISMDEFQTICGLRSFYTGYVFDKEKGDLFFVDSVNNMRTSSSPSYPNERNLGHSYTTKFHEVYGKRITITLEEIGNSDVVYDDRGNYIELKSQSNQKRKGQIYIRKETYHKYIVDLEIPGKDKTEKHPGYEDIRIQDLKEMLSAEAYSKIFTHIVTLMTGDKIKKVRNGLVSVVIHPRTSGLKVQTNNIKYRDEIPSKDTHAYYLHAEWKRDNVLAAILYGHPTDEVAINNRERYSTLWNVLNLLVGHEFEGHGEKGYTDKTKTHHKAYEYQINHPTWKNTTKSYRNKIYEKYEEEYRKEKR